uniref:SEA domain-containing protein n=1 Tax=Heterorhabditis bacteriophora TaxID=37862 RepID=A0A1I7X608_HETBA
MNTLIWYIRWCNRVKFTGQGGQIRPQQMERRRIWDLEPKSKLVLGLLVAISLAMFIAGAIMLAIGIHKANICGNCMKPGPIPSSSLPTAIFSSSYTQEFQWSNDLLNPSSKLFLDTTEKIIKNIKEAFHPNRRKRYMTQLAVQEPLNIAVTKFM